MIAQRLPTSFALLLLFLSFTKAVPVQRADKKWPFPPSSNPTGKSKFTLDLLKSEEYQVQVPQKPTFNPDGTGTLNLAVTGPPGEIVLQVRRTKVSWDKRTIYKDPFISQPTSRGTISIILTCAFTLFLCVWTTFHANIEPAKEHNEDDSWLRKFGRQLTGKWWRKVGWSTVIIIFPECPLFFAVFERRTAKRLCKLIDRALEEENSFSHRVHADVQFASDGRASQASNQTLLRGGNYLSKKHQWERKRQLGYFALMGGFAIRNPQTNKLDILTPQGVYYVCRHLDSAEELVRLVDDKNGASGLAKCLVVFQVVWILIQIVFRYKARLSVTLLETHTVIHAGCALLTYAMWFKKPFDIKHPIELQLDDRIIEILNQHKDNGDGKGYDDYNVDPINLLNPMKGQSYMQPLHAKLPNLPHSQQFSNNQWLHSQPNYQSQQYRISVPFSIHLLTDRAGQTKLASRTFSAGESRRPGNLLGLTWAIYGRLGKRIRRIWKECLLMAVASIFYGGMHLWAYAAGHFPTSFERLGWLLALLATAFSGIGSVVILLISSRFARSDAGTGKKRKGFTRFLSWLFILLFISALVISVAARVALVAESFASMRDPSAKAFRIAEWTNLSII